MNGSRRYPHPLPTLWFGMLTLLILLPGLAQAQPSLPPRPPTPTPTATPAPPHPPRPAPPGATIELQAHFPATWPWDEAHWQSVWTVVQWQDGLGEWHDVEGWQGTPDDVTVDGGEVTARKRWWVAEADLGKGPFRWVACAGRGGRRLGTSKLFDLPGSVGAVTTVAVWLADP